MLFSSAHPTVTKPFRVRRWTDRSDTRVLRTRPTWRWIDRLDLLFLPGGHLTPRFAHKKADKTSHLPPMPNFKALSESERQQRRRARALKKQARKSVARRVKILTGLADPFTAALIERTLHDAGVSDYVPLELVPTRQLRRRVAQLNLETQLFALEPAPSAPSTEPAVDPPALEHQPELDVQPTQLTPRPRGRSALYPLFPLLPFMPDQQQTLLDIFRIGPAGSGETGLGRRHRCPCCCPNEITRNNPPLDLSVYPTAAGDLVFRCRRCGWSLDSVEFFQRTEPIHTLASAAALLADCRCLSATLPAAQLAGYVRLAHLRNLFEEGLERVKASIPAGARRPVPFGAWALLSTHRIQRLFPGYRFSKHLPAECWGRISVDVFGRWHSLHLDHPRAAGTSLYRLELRDWESPASMTFFLAPKAEFTEGLELIVCEESNVAQVVRQNLGLWFDHERVPTLALVERCTAPPNEPLLPFSFVWAVVRGSRTARFALPFCAPTEVTGEPRVLVRRVPEEIHHQELPYLEVLREPTFFRDLATASECVADLAAQVAAERDHQPLPIVLAGVLDHPGIHLATRHRLLREVSARTGVASEALVQEGFNPWSGGPYALNATGGTVYIAREGRYWRKGQRDREFTAVANFRLRLTEDRVDGGGRVTHHAVLEIGEKQVSVSFSTAVLGSPSRLLNLLTGEARKAEAEYPIISDPKAKRLLPELVKATQARPPVVRLHAIPEDGNRMSATPDTIQRVTQV